jgi:hypothetical protein
MFDTPQKRKKGPQRSASGYNLNLNTDIIAPGGGGGGGGGGQAVAMEGTTEIYSVAVSCDGKYVASGGKDKLVYIWDSRSGTLIDSFRGHGKAVSALAFRLKTHQLFSGSHDRCVKHWNVDDMGYVESLYGHGTEVNSLDVLHKEKVLSSGHDRTVRLWKLETDSQLVFNGHHNSIDCVRYMSENSFVSGGVDGSLALWSAAKKKPVCMVYNAHPSETSSGVPSWITSLTSLRRTDLAISGSCDGISSPTTVPPCFRLLHVVSRAAFQTSVRQHMICPSECSVPSSFLRVITYIWFLFFLMTHVAGYVRFWLTKLFPRTFEQVCNMPLKVPPQTTRPLILITF